MTDKMARQASVFEQTYRNYLRRISGIDLISRAEPLGAATDGSALIIPFFKKPYRVSSDGVFDASGKPANFAKSVVLCRYIVQCPEQSPPPGGWVTYREFRDAGPLIGYFTSNTNKIIETAFSGNIFGLKAACEPLGGIAFDDGSSYDISIQFDFLPKIPMLLRFNDKDGEFPARWTILFRASAENYLDMECLAIGGTFLSGILIGKSKDPGGDVKSWNGA